MQLFVQPDTSMSQHIADDVTGVVWVDDQALVFSTSAIHGQMGGVFRYTCARKDAALEAVLLPEDYNGANAQGHFELDEFKDGSLFYYHLPNAEELGDKPFPTKDYLRKLDLGKDLENVDPQTLKTVGHDCDLHHPFIP